MKLVLKESTAHGEPNGTWYSTTNQHGLAAKECNNQVNHI